MAAVWYSVQGGGPHSRLFQCAIAPLARLHWDEVYLSCEPWGEDSYQLINEYVQTNLDNMQNYGIDKPYHHVMNYVLEQTWHPDLRYRGCLDIGPLYDKVNRRIEDSPWLDRYREVLAQLRFNQDVIRACDQVQARTQISSRSLGVHVRTTTMSCHPEYQWITTQDYIRVIEQRWNRGHFDWIYVASDNHQSLRDIQAHFPGLVRCLEPARRFQDEHSRESDLCREYDWWFHKSVWIESMVEAQMLAHCGELICRESNLANMAFVMSDTIQHVQRVFSGVQR